MGMRTLLFGALLLVGILGAVSGYDAARSGHSVWSYLLGGLTTVQGLVVILAGGTLATLGLSGLLITSRRRRMTRGFDAGRGAPSKIPRRALGVGVGRTTPLGEDMYESNRHGENDQVPEP